MPEIGRRLPQQPATQPSTPNGVNPQAPAQPQPQPTTQLPSAGILSRARQVQQLPPPPLKIVIYGQNRVGKTTFACQFPKPLLLVSCEPAKTGGAESIRNVPGVSLLQEGIDFRGRDGLLALIKELMSSGHNFRSVVLDSATSMQDIILRDLMNLPEVPATLKWGTVDDGQYKERSEIAKEVLRKFVNLPMDTIILAKEKDHNPPKELRVTKSGKEAPDMRPKFLRGVSNESYVAADLGGATVNWLQDACDAVCRLFVEEEVKEVEMVVLGKKERQTVTTGKFIRYLRTSYHPQFSAGLRSCQPEKVPEVMPNPTYEKLMRIMGRM